MRFTVDLVFALCLCFVKSVDSATDLILQATVDRNYHNAYSVAKCMLQIPNIEVTTVLFLMNNSTELTTKIFRDDMIQIFVGHSIPVLISKDLHYIDDDKKINPHETLIVLQLNNCDGLWNIDVGFITTSIKYVLIIHDYSDVGCQSKLVGVPSEFARYNVIFVVPDSNGVYEILSFYPQIDGTICDYSTVEPPEHVNTCADGYLKGPVVFRDKAVTNMQKCTLRVGTLYSEPLIWFHRYPEVPLIELIPMNSTGMEIEIINIVAEKYNTSIYKFLKVLYETNNVHRIVNKKYDVVAGGYVRKDYETKGFLSTAIFASSDWTWIYPVKRVERNWREFVTKLNGLYLFGVVYIVYCFLFNFIRYVDGLQLSFADTFLYSWGALLGTNSLQLPRTFKQSILNAFYLYMCLHLSAYVSTQLSAFLAVSTPTQVYKTHEEIMKSGLTPYLHRLYINHQDFGSYDGFREFALPFKACILGECEKGAINGGVAVEQSIYMYTWPASILSNGESTLLKAGNVYTIYYSMGVGESSIFADSIMKTVDRLVDSGITEKLLDNSIGLGIRERVDSAMRAAAANDYSCESGCRIAMTHIWPAFLLWLLGCALAACVFAAELLWKKFGYIFTFVDP